MVSVIGAIIWCDLMPNLNQVNRNKNIRCDSKLLFGVMIDIAMYGQWF
jgi:hypothetical protein